MQLLAHLRAQFAVDAADADVGTDAEDIWADRSQSETRASRLLAEMRAQMCAECEDGEEEEEAAPGLVREEREAGEDGGEGTEGSPARRLLEQMRAQFATEGVGAPADEDDFDAVVASRKPFSCWTVRGNWTLYGYTWMQAHQGNTVSLEKVKTLLHEHPWSWDIDFSSAVAPSESWFHITPSTLMTKVACELMLKLSGVLAMDYHGVVTERFVPSDQLSREPIIWIPGLVYHWNMARGWCMGPCKLEDAPLAFTAAGTIGPVDGHFTIGRDGRPEPRSGNWTEMQFTYSLQRKYNEVPHQWWNVSGCLHTLCNSFFNSHPTNGYDSRRVPDSSLPPYSLAPGLRGGGPDGFFEDHHGGAVSWVLDIDPTRTYAANMRRIRRWLHDNGIEHSDDCHRRGRCVAHCPHGIKRDALVAEFGSEHLGRRDDRPSRRQR